MAHDEDVTCPFCGESGFDLYGLKLHLTGEMFLLAGPCEAFLNCSDPAKSQSNEDKKAG